MWTAQPPARATSNSSAENSAENLAPGDNAKLISLLQYAIYAIGAAIAIQFAFQAFFVAYILLFPFVYLYAVQQCPPMESFDAKRELRRVMRGADLPAGDPNKPKGLLNETVARVQATVATELATGLGYEVSMMNVIGACVLVRVRVPSIERDCYWIGAFGSWYYMFQSVIPQDTKID